MKASNTELYNAITGSVWFQSDDVENLALAISRAESDPMAYVEVGRMYANMVRKVVGEDRKRTKQRKIQTIELLNPTRFDLTAKGIDEVDALRCGGVL